MDVILLMEVIVLSQWEKKVEERDQGGHQIDLIPGVTILEVGQDVRRYALLHQHAIPPMF